MDAHLFRRFCQELAPALSGARLEKLQEPAADVLVLTCYGGGRKRYLCCRFGRKEPFFFLTSRRVSVGRPPTAAVMRLRKYVSGRRVAAVVAQWCERRLWLLLAESRACPPSAAEPAATWLLLDLREGPSLHFLSVGDAPVAGEPVWPGGDLLDDALRNWREWPVLTPALRRTLALLDPPERLALLADLRQGGGDIFCYGPPASSSAEALACVRAVSAWPLPAALRTALAPQGDAAAPAREVSGSEAFPLLERAGQDMVLARLAEAEAREALLPLRRRQRRLCRLLDRLREEESRLRAMQAGAADALALQGELWRWPADCHAAVVHVPAGQHGPERDIALDARYTLREAMERLFHTARRGRRGLEMLAERRAALERELAGLSGEGAGEGAGERQPRPAVAGLPAASLPLLPQLPKNVQLFVSSDGFTLLRGRDAKGNLAARRLAAPHDIWLHAENGPGAHVIIRRAHGGQEVPERTLDEAGSLAACKSWQKDAARARIQYAEVRHVRPLRNAPAGTVRVDRALPSRDVPVDASLESSLLP